MLAYSFSRAEKNLDEVFAKAWEGEEIIITKNGLPPVTITRYDDDRLIVRTASKSTAQK